MNDDRTDVDRVDQSRRKRHRWNTDASPPSGPGSDALVGGVYDAINWCVKKWRVWRGN